MDNQNHQTGGVPRALMPHILIADGPGRHALVIVDREPTSEELQTLLPGCDQGAFRPLDPTERDRIMRVVRELVR